MATRRRRVRFPFFRLRFSSFVFLLLALTSLTGVLVLSFMWMLPEASKFINRPKLDSMPVSQDFCSSIQKPPWVCAHGGDTSQAPPNTFAAYAMALEAGVECVEVDASRTMDGHIVALHDRDLQAFSGNSSVRVGDLRYEQILKFDAAFGSQYRFTNQKVPSLEEAINMLSGDVRQVTVDIKVGPPLYDRRLAEDILEVVEKTGCSNCLMWSKQDAIVEELKSLKSASKVGYIVMKDFQTGEVDALIRMKSAEVVGIYYGLAEKSVVDEIRSNNKEVHVWTVNSKQAMVDMVRLGVDSIVTNDPHLLQRVIEDHRAACRKGGFG